MDHKMTKKKSLGQGLAALIGEAEDSLSAQDQNATTKDFGKDNLYEIPIEFLHPNKNQPRKLFDNEKINVPLVRRKGNGKSLILEGCNGNNLKNIDVQIPLGLMVGITGVSGSGKSTLINETLYPILNAHIYCSAKVIRYMLSVTFVFILIESGIARSEPSYIIKVDLTEMSP